MRKFLNDLFSEDAISTEGVKTCIEEFIASDITRKDLFDLLLDMTSIILVLKDENESISRDNKRISMASKVLIKSINELESKNKSVERILFGTNEESK